MKGIRPPLLATGVILALASGCGGGGGPETRRSAAPVTGDPGPVHIHGLGVDPADKALFIATHTGLFRAGDGERRAVRVADRWQDTMGFKVLGKGHFLGSGHPDGRDKLPPFLGLIESRDAGQTWKPISLLGKVDFHVLQARGRYVYGFGSDWKSRGPRFLASSDGGRSWQRRTPPETLVSLALEPASPNRLVASGERALYRSRDGGRHWTEVAGRPGLLAWDRGGVVLISVDGTVRRGSGGSWKDTGSVGGPPAAFEAAADGALYAALHDGTVKRSVDGGRTWTVRTSP